MFGTASPVGDLNNERHGERDRLKLLRGVSVLRGGG
jgi:hypothetical protein